MINSSYSNREPEISKIAYDLLTARPMSLEVSVPWLQIELHSDYGDDVILVDGKIRFRDLDVLSVYAARYFLDTVKRQNPANRFQACKTLVHTEARQGTSAGLRTLAKLSEDSADFEQLWEGIENQEVIQAMSLIGASLHFFDDSAFQNLYNVLLRQYNCTQHNLMETSFFHRLVSVFVQRPEVARSLLVRQREDISEATSGIYLAATTALFSKGQKKLVEETLDDIASPSIPLRNSALVALCFYRGTNSLSDSLNKKIDKKLKWALQSSDDSARDSILDAVGRYIGGLDLLDDLMNLSGDLNVRAAWVACKLMSKNLNNIVPARSKQLHQCIEVLAQAEVNLNYLDNIFAALLNDLETVEEACICMSTWVCSAPSMEVALNFPLLFPQTCYVLTASPQISAFVLSRLLLHENRRVSLVLNEIYTGNGQLVEAEARNLAHSKLLVTNYNLSEFELLAYRTVGFLEGIIVVPLLVSLMVAENLTPEKILVFEFLLEQVSYDYPNRTIESLEAVGRTYPQRERWSKTLVQRIESVWNTRKDLTAIKEIQPTTRLSESIARQRQLEFEEGLDASSENSVFSKLVTKIPVKAGTQVRMTKQNSNLVMDLQKVTLTYTPPKRLVTDPVGLLLNKHLHRLLKMSEPTKCD